MADLHICPIIRIGRICNVNNPYCGFISGNCLVAIRDTETYIMHIVCALKLYLAYRKYNYTKKKVFTAIYKTEVLTPDTHTRLYLQITGHRHSIKITNQKHTRFVGWRRLVERRARWLSSGS